MDTNEVVKWLLYLMFDRGSYDSRRWSCRGLNIIGLRLVDGAGVQVLMGSPLMNLINFAAKKING